MYREVLVHPSPGLPMVTSLYQTQEVVIGIPQGLLRLRWFYKHSSMCVWFCAILLCVTTTTKIQYFMWGFEELLRGME